MKKRKKSFNYVALIIGIVIIIISLLINKLTFIRLLLCLLGMTFITSSFKIKNFKKNIILFILILIASIFIDSIFSATFARIPIFTYNITTMGKTRVYNSIGYRIWQCDINNSNMKVDTFYTKGYLCDAKNIEQIDSNSFLNSVIENYGDYHNSYVKIRGKISKKNSQNSIEMQPYEKNDLTINGYVNFADNITLKILFKNNITELDLYDVYDEITVIGIVKNLEHLDEKFTIYLSESELVSEEKFDTYEIIINKENECSSENNIVYSDEKNTIYTYCLDGITIKYGNNNYELSSALSSSKITIDSLFKGEKSKEVDENGNTLYKLDYYNILECNTNNSKDIIIGPTDEKIDSSVCNINDNTPV